MKTETVYVVRPVGTDNLGNPLGPPEADRPIPGCFVIPRTTGEDNDRGAVPVEGYQVIKKSGQPLGVTSQDKIRCRGELWDIQGPPAYYAGKATIITLFKVGG